MSKPSQPLTQLEFEERDFDLAEVAAKRLGYTQTAYTSTSALWGLFCLPDRPGQKEGCFIKTKELGLMFVSTLEDLRMDDLFAAENAKLVKVSCVEDLPAPDVTNGADGFLLPAWGKKNQYRATAWAYLNREDGGKVVYYNGVGYTK